MINEIEGVPYHKTTINIPLKLYKEMKTEAKVLGINFNALLLIKLNKLKEQDNALDSLKVISDALLKHTKEEELNKIFDGVTIKKDKNK